MLMVRMRGEADGFEFEFKREGSRRTLSSTSIPASEWSSMRIKSEDKEEGSALLLCPEREPPLSLDEEIEVRGGGADDLVVLGSGLR